MTEYETLQITASVWSIFDSRWNCFNCANQRNFEQLKKVKGCISTPKANYTVEGFKLNKCLGNFTSREVYGYFELNKLFEKGIMPFEGAVSEQPAKLIDLFNMIEQLKNEKQLEASKKKRK